MGEHAVVVERQPHTGTPCYGQCHDAVQKAVGTWASHGPDLDVERLAYALNRAFGAATIGGPYNAIGADPIAAAERLATEYAALSVTPDRDETAPEAEQLAAIADELGRLRRIETAARNVADRDPTVVDGEGLGGEWCHFCDQQTPGHEPSCDWQALRAALEPLP